LYVLCFFSFFSFLLGFSFCGDPLLSSDSLPSLSASPSLSLSLLLSLLTSSSLRFFFVSLAGFLFFFAVAALGFLAALFRESFSSASCTIALICAALMGTGVAVTTGRRRGSCADPAFSVPVKSITSCTFVAGTCAFRYHSTALSSTGWSEA